VLGQYPKSIGCVGKGEALIRPMLRGRTDSSLRDPLRRAIEDSGPVMFVCACLGNSPKVAEKHYLKVHEGHYAKALLQVA